MNVAEKTLLRPSNRGFAFVFKIMYIKRYEINYKERRLLLYLLSILCTAPSRILITMPGREKYLPSAYMRQAQGNLVQTGTLDLSQSDSGLSHGPWNQWWAKLLRLLTVNSLSYFVKIKY
jgi:hypothetical protein